MQQLYQMVLQVMVVYCGAIQILSVSGQQKKKKINTVKYSWFLLPSELFDFYRTSLSFTPPTDTNYFQMKFLMHHRTQPGQVGKVKEEAHHRLLQQKQKVQGPREEKDELFIP